MAEFEPQLPGKRPMALPGPFTSKMKRIVKKGNLLIKIETTVHVCLSSTKGYKKSSSFSRPIVAKFDCAQ